MPKVSDRQWTLAQVDNAIKFLMSREMTMPFGSEEQIKERKRIQELCRIKAGIFAHRNINPSIPVPKLRENRDFFFKWATKHFRKIVRMNKASFHKLENMLEKTPTFINMSNRQTRVWVQLAVTLEYLAHGGTGGSVAQLGRKWGIADGTVNLFVDRILEAIGSMAPTLIKWPDHNERQQISARVKEAHGFPHVIGFVDGTYVIYSQKPAVDGSTYFTRKSTYAMNVQAICDDRRMIRFVQAGWPGSVSDSTAFKDTSIASNEGAYFSKGGYLIGDAGYALSNRMLTPYRRPQTDGNERNTMFNEDLASARVVIENTFGILKNRWQCLKQMHFQVKKEKDLDKVIKVIAVTVCLHNFLIQENDEWPVEKQPTPKRVELPTDDTSVSQWREYINDFISARR